MKIILVLLSVAISMGGLFVLPSGALAAYDPGLVITDGEMTAKNSMSEAQVQEFLVSKGSFLANFTVPAPRTVNYYIDSTRTLTTYENTIIGPYGVATEVDVQGWRASKVIWQVSQWYGVNPQVVLSIIEKESSFILGRTSGRADGSIAVPGANSYATYAWLMGYAYTEDTSNPAVNACGVATPGANPTRSCAGFAAQLDNATWAVANWMNLANNQSSGNNYSCPSWSGSYRTNYTTRLCDGEWITPRSGATAALYRYTPHTGLTGGYSGNRAFYLIYTNWFTPYGYEFVSALNPPKTIGAGQTKTAQVVLKNTGATTWYNDSQTPLISPMRLYVNSGSDFYSPDGSWESTGRIRMTTASVSPGETGTFSFTVRAPNMPGTYRLGFFPIIENTKMLEDTGMAFEIIVPDWHIYKFVSAINPPLFMQPNQVADVQIKLQNLGSAPWNSDNVDPNFRPFRLKIISGSPNFYENTTWVNPESIKMTTNTVTYGESAYFNFKIKAPITTGSTLIRFVPEIANLCTYTDIGMGFSSTIMNNGGVFRYWSPIYNSHFYTVSLGEKKLLDNHPLEWKYEGQTFNVSYSSSPGLSPVYRFWNNRTNAHYYTTSLPEKDFFVNNPHYGWQFETIAWYASSSNNGGLPVYRFYNRAAGSHFYTSNEDEKNLLILKGKENWALQGVSWYTPI